MSLELDHLFCFCDSSLSEIELLSSAGFSIAPYRSHKGQGTANRRILFEENYIELIYLESLADAIQNPLALDKRANWETTEACPFGIALRGSVPEKYQDYFWEYLPDYLESKNPILISKFSTENLSAPLVFIMPEGMHGYKPSSWPNFDPNLLSHEAKSLGIKNVQIQCREKLSELAELVSPQVELILGQTWDMKIDLMPNNTATNLLELNPILKVAY